MKEPKKITHRQNEPAATSAAGHPTSRELLAAVQRFVQGLEQEAGTGKLARFQHIAQTLDYLLSRYLPSATENSAASAKRPGDLAVEPDLICALKYLDAPALGEALPKLQKTIKTLVPYENQPHGRRPVIVGPPEGQAAIREQLRKEAATHPRHAGWDALTQQWKTVLKLLRDWEDQIIADLGQSGGQLQPDGPQTPNLFHWKGRTVLLSQKGWKLVDYLWNVRNHTATKDDVCVAVWGDEEMANHALPNAILRINKKFLDRKIPLTLSQKAGHVQLQLPE